MRVVVVVALQGQKLAPGELKYLGPLSSLGLAGAAWGSRYLFGVAWWRGRGFCCADCWRGLMRWVFETVGVVVWREGYGIFETSSPWLGLEIGDVS